MRTLNYKGFSDDMRVARFRARSAIAGAWARPAGVGANAMSATAKTAEPKMAARAKIDTAKPTAFLAAGGAADGSTAPDPAREALGVACGPPTASTITIVDAIGPPFVGKTFALVNGKLVKTKVVASIWDGKARMVEVPTAEAMAGRS